MTRPRILFVGHWDPTGRTGGAVLRTLGVGGALATAGEVDYLQRKGRSWRSPDAVVRRPVVPPDLPFANWIQVAAHGVPHALKGPLRYPWAAAATVAPRRARPLLAARYPRISAVALRVAVDAMNDYDLVWFYRLETILAFWPLFTNGAVPCVADVDDLTTVDRDEAESARGTREWLARARRPLEAHIDGLDRRAWQRWQDEIVARADTVVLSNPTEAASVRARRVRVVSNGWTLPPRRGSRSASIRPVVTFVGSLHYFPNHDAARFLVGEVVPLLRAELGHAFEVRIVGEGPAAMHALADDPNVTVTGYVDDLPAELARADIVVVPLRHGSGTRLKILEAFANEIPVVSTTIGASGLDVVSGQELLLADTAQDLAGAVVRLVHDEALRARLTTSARDLVARTYDWSVVAQQVRSIVDETIGSAGVESAPGPVGGR